MKMFGQTPAERQAGSARKCRDIVSEIMKFGVSQDEVLSIIQLLSMELENREVMVAIGEVIAPHRTDRLVQLEQNTDEV